MKVKRIYITCEKGKSKSKKALVICQIYKNSVNCDSYKKQLLKETSIISNVGVPAQLDQEETWF